MNTTEVEFLLNSKPLSAEAAANRQSVPGFVMSLFAEQYRFDRRDACRRLGLTGNLCRCTPSLGPGTFLVRLSQPTPVSAQAEYIDRRRAGYTRPIRLEECLAILTSDPRATSLAGGFHLGARCWNTWSVSKRCARTGAGVPTLPGKPGSQISEEIRDQVVALAISVRPAIPGVVAAFGNGGPVEWASPELETAIQIAEGVALP